MKTSDYVMNCVANVGVSHVFCVTGGGAMHLNNSLGRNERLTGVFMLHEQGASIAAEAYARVKDGFGCCLVTSGPGATNAITGLVGAYIDSIPVIFISGQAKRSDLVNGQKIRQFGIQEVDIISMVSKYTKYAVQLTDPSRIKYELEKALAIAMNGRPGPVWIDIPLDIQAMSLDFDEQVGFDHSELPIFEASDADISETISLINNAKKPVIILGHGIRLAGAIEEARNLYNYLDIPVLTSWNGVDLIEDTHPLYFGRPGAVGQRAANFIMQTADLVITIGSRLNLLSTGYNFESFLHKAKHIMVDIDINEMNKISVHPYLKIEADAKSFINKLMLRKSEIENSKWKNWINRCGDLIQKYPNRTSAQEPRTGFVSTYDVVDRISNLMSDRDIYQFTSSGTSVDIAMKVLRIKWGQRAFLTKGLAAMGYDVPACIGSCIAGNRRTICVTGDGSIAMNLQEFEVIHRLNLPIKIFVADNRGYSMIFGSQKNNFNLLTGCTKDNGLTLPDIAKVASAFNIVSMSITNPNEIDEVVQRVFDCNGPVVCVFKADIMQQIVPKQTNYMLENGQMASRPLEDMSPLLNRAELDEVMNAE